MLPQATRRSPSTGPAANPIKYPAPNAVAAMVQVIIHQAGGLLQHEHFDAQVRDGRGVALESRLAAPRTRVSLLAARRSTSS